MSYSDKHETISEEIRIRDLLEIDPLCYGCLVKEEYYMRNSKRLFALALALLGLLGCLTGCTGKTEPSLTVSPANGGSAMGRYVEKDFPLPKEGAAMDMVMLSTGQLRIAIGGDDEIRLYTTNSDRSAWEENQELPGEILNSGRVESLALAPDGTVFCDTVVTDGETGDNAFRFWIVEPDGGCRELPIVYPDFNPQDGFLIASCDFTDDNRLFAEFGVTDVREVDTQTGALSEKRNDLVQIVLTVCCGGNDMYLVGFDDCSVLHEGTDTALAGALQEKIVSSLQNTMGNTPRITFWENGDGYLFFTTHEGLFSYAPGGSIVEELVSGARTSLGDPSFYTEALAGADDGSFYVMGVDSEAYRVYHYVYDPDMPTVPSHQLRVYSLYDDEDLRQIITQYQKANPDVAIDLEVGLTGEDGVTEADAIRALNTQILAGDGPDILELDGLSLDTFLEKDLLIDLRGAAEQAGPLLEQVANCYETDGKLSVIPTTYAIPAIYGPGHIVSQIHDLDSLVAAAAQSQAENPQARSVLLGYVPVLVADLFYDSCSAAWMRGDGTLDEEKLAEYYAAMQSLYALDAGMREEMADFVAELAEPGGYTPGDYTGMSGAIQILLESACLTPGTIDGIRSFAHALAGDDQLDSYETAPLSLQVSNVFLPRRIMGVLNTSANQDYAVDFVAFMLSQDIQFSCLSTGFPVNRAAFDKMINEEQEMDGSIYTSYGDGAALSLDITYPDQRHRQQLKTWVDALTTPALTNRIIRNMVMEQANACMKGELTPQEAAKAAIGALNLYLSE